MRIDRIWATPSSETFTITPIAELIKEEMTDISWNFHRVPPYGENNIVKINRVWIDPFCGNSTLATIRNDLNLTVVADYHLDALDFLKMFDNDSIDGVLYDPPYLPNKYIWSDIKDEIARIVKPGGKVICCGSKSVGIGVARGFNMTRVLLVPYGENYNDTIVTVELKLDVQEATVSKPSNNLFVGDRL